MAAIARLPGTIRDHDPQPASRGSAGLLDRVRAALDRAVGQRVLQRGSMEVSGGIGDAPAAATVRAWRTRRRGTPAAMASHRELTLRRRLAAASASSSGPRHRARRRGPGGWPRPRPRWRGRGRSLASWTAWAGRTPARTVATPALGLVAGSRAGPSAGRRARAGRLRWAAGRAEQQHRARPSTVTVTGSPTGRSGAGARHPRAGELKRGARRSLVGPVPGAVGVLVNGTTGRRRRGARRAGGYPPGRRGSRASARSARARASGRSRRSAPR